MNKSILIITVLASLACGVQGNFTERPDEVYNNTAHSNKVSTVVNVEMVVTGKLNIREEPSAEARDLGDLYPGDAVTCQLPFRVIGDSAWCLHSRGWSNVRWMEAK